MPDLVTRHELYARMHEHLADCPRLLTDFDREVLLRWRLKTQRRCRAAVQSSARAAGGDARVL